MRKELNSVKKRILIIPSITGFWKSSSHLYYMLCIIFSLFYLNNEFININIYMIICQNPIDNWEIYVLLYSTCYIGLQLCNNCRKSVFIYNLALREDLREVFCVKNFADYVKDPQI